MRQFTVALGLVCLLGTALKVHAQSDVRLLQEQPELQSSLLEARDLLSKKKWSRALSAYDRLLAENGNTLVPVPDNKDEAIKLCVPLGWLCHKDLSNLPAEADKLYQSASGGPADILLQRGRKNRDETVLRQLVDTYFATPQAAGALAFLGDLAFANGDFPEARLWWQLALRHPHSKSAKENASLQGKRLLGRLFAGRSEQARKELHAFRKEFPQESGHLAGTEGNLADILQTWIDKGSPDFWENEQWLSFAGNSQHNPTSERHLPEYLLKDEPTWSVQVSRPVSDTQANLHPLIIDNIVLYSDGLKVFAVDLLKGLRLAEVPGFEPGKAAKFSHGNTLLSANEKGICAVLGQQHFPQEKPVGGDKSILLFAEWKQDKRKGLTISWRATPDIFGADRAVFQGNVLLDDNRALATIVSRRGLKQVVSLACYQFPSGDRLWLEDLYEFPFREESGAVANIPILTSAGSLVIVTGNPGITLAIDKSSRKIRWALRYPSTSEVRSTASSCLYCDGQVVLAPADSDRLICLDAWAGDILWQRKNLQVSHILGCTSDAVFLTTDEGLYGIDRKTGQTIWQQPDTGVLPADGRGFIFSDSILWPTQHSSHPVVQVNPQKGFPFPPSGHALPAGNLTFVRGCLLSSGKNRIDAVISPKLLLRKRQLEAQLSESPKNLFLLAQSEADAGLGIEALLHYRKAEQLLSSSDVHDDELLAIRCRKSRQDWWLRKLQTTEPAKDWQKSAEQAFADEFPMPWRLSALNRLLKNPSYRKFAHTYLQKHPEMNRVAVWLNQRPVRGVDLFAQAPKKQAITAKDLPRCDYRFPLQTIRQFPSGSLVKTVDFAQPKPGFFWTYRDGLFGYTDKSGQTPWQVQMPFVPTHVADFGDYILVGGSHGIASLKDGQVQWGWVTPGLPCPERFSVLSPDPWSTSSQGMLSDFAPDMCRFLHDNRHWLTINRSTGELEHDSWLSGAQLPALYPPGYVRSRPDLSAPFGNIRIVNNRIRFMQGEGEDRHSLWTHEPRWRSTLSGESFRLFFGNKAFLALLPRNVGYDLVRIDPQSGKEVWSAEFRLSSSAFSRSAVHVGKQHVHYVSGNVLICRSLATGDLLWQKTLPDLGVKWRLRSNSGGVFVYPDKEASVRMLPMTTTLLRTSVPVRRRPKRSFCLRVYQPESGKLLQELTFPGGHWGEGICFHPDFLVVTAGGKAYIVTGKEAGEK